VPIKELIALASAIMAGVMVTHPFTWKTEIRKLEYSMFKEVSDTRSWGNPSIFQYSKHPNHITGRHHHAEK
jgi:hypothetical protein